MAKVTAKLDTVQARAAFPNIKGLDHVVSAERFGDHLAIVNMGRGAHAVILNGNWEGCCPSRKFAMALVDKLAAVVAKHLSASVRC